MIAANELRIGNWVKLNDQEDGKLVKFKYFSETLRVAFFYKEVMGEFTANIAGIELSPEILEKCGFVMHKTSQLWRKDNFYLHHYLVSDNEYCFKYSDFTSSSIQYLHQLQNLYFALCGEELNYTP